MSDQKLKTLKQNISSLSDDVIQLSKKLEKVEGMLKRRATKEWTKKKINNLTSKDKLQKYDERITSLETGQKEIIRNLNVIINVLHEDDDISLTKKEITDKYLK